MTFRPLMFGCALTLLSAASSPVLAQNYYNDQNRAREDRQRVQRDTENHYDSVAADNRAPTSAAVRP